MAKPPHNHQSPVCPNKHLNKQNWINGYRKALNPLNWGRIIIGMNLLLFSGITLAQVGSKPSLDALNHFYNTQYESNGESQTFYKSSFTRWDTLVRYLDSKPIYWVDPTNLWENGQIVLETVGKDYYNSTKPKTSKCFKMKLKFRLVIGQKVG